MAQRIYENGETVFGEGEPSSAVGRVLDGRADVFKSHAGSSVLIGTVAAGDHVGEMAALEGRPHGATVRAQGRLTVDLVPAGEFIANAVADPDVARTLLVRLSARLHLLNGAYAALLPEQVSRPAGDENLRVTLHAGSDATQRLLSGSGRLLDRLPVYVGRVPSPDEPPPIARIDFRFEDAVPFRLSRSHFAVVRDGEGVAVRDMHSHLGTRVNGRSIGDHFGDDLAVLNLGENTVVAGGRDSPFVFRLVVEPAD